MRRLLGLVVCALLVASSWAEEPRKPATRVHHVPYRLTDTKHVLVRAKLNGKGPFNFLIDTGAPALFVATAVAKKVGVEPGADGWGTFDRFEIEGGIVLTRTRGRIDDPFQLEGMNGLGLAGAELHGVIGYTVLARYRLEFDFTRDKMAWTPLAFEPPPPLGLDGKADQGSLEALGGIMKLAGSLLGKKAEVQVTPRGFLGVELEEREGGLWIRAVLDGSPAAAAGLARGDRLRRFAGQAVTSADDLQRQAARLTPGQSVELTIQRAGHERQVRVQAGKGF